MNPAMRGYQKNPQSGGGMMGMMGGLAPLLAMLQQRQAMGNPQQTQQRGFYNPMQQYGQGMDMASQWSQQQAANAAQRDEQSANRVGGRNRPVMTGLQNMLRNFGGGGGGNFWQTVARGHNARR